MPLTFNLKDIKVYKKLCYAEAGTGEDGKELYKINDNTERVIFKTMVVGLGEITEKNYVEFATRVLMYQGVVTSRNPLTVSDIKQHIGLRVNVSNESRSKFMRRMEGVVYREQCQKGDE